MKNYDDFDLDLKIDPDLENQSILSLSLNYYDCLEKSIDWSIKLSKAADCFSNDGQCTKVRSGCTPCTSGYQYEEPNAVVNC